MQTILGSNGQIGHELAKELYRSYTKDIRLVSRNPKRIHPSDEVLPADLLDYDQTYAAIEGSDIVYFTVGLPMDTQLWESNFMPMLENVLRACRETGSRFVFFDNTYMYAKTAEVQTEDSSFHPEGPKSTVRAQMAQKVLDTINSQELEAVICRAPEFYGPDRTQSITNSLIFDRIKEGKRALVPVSDHKLRTIIYTPDASRAMALIANTPEAYGQTWLLPTPEPITYQDLIKQIQEVTGQEIKYSVLRLWLLKAGSWFSPALKELQELLPRYEVDNLISSDKFKEHFPDFGITSYKEGIQQILQK